MPEKKKAVCVVSGGMDSALSASIAKNEGYEIIAVHFNYGQRTQNKELTCFKEIVKDLEIKTKYIIDLPFFEQIGATALIGESYDIPTDGIKPGIPITYVPYRNGIFLSIAAAIAQKHEASALYIGVVEEDSSGYPDCREQFIAAINSAINLGLREESSLEIKTPLIHLSKAQIVQKSLEMGVNLGHTWSCYKNEDAACGVCDSCRLRLEGFKKAAKVDPVPYEK